MGYLEGRNQVRLDEACKKPWVGVKGECKLPLKDNKKSKKLKSLGKALAVAGAVSVPVGTAGLVKGIKDRQKLNKQIDEINAYRTTFKRRDEAPAICDRKAGWVKRGRKLNGSVR